MGHSVVECVTSIEFQFPLKNRAIRPDLEDWTKLLDGTKHKTIIVYANYDRGNGTIFFTELGNLTF
jgi:hypothetical protein